MCVIMWLLHFYTTFGGANQSSCQTQLSLNCVRLFWGSLGVVLWLSCGFDNLCTEKARRGHFVSHRQLPQLRAVNFKTKMKLQIFEKVIIVIFRKL